MAKTSDAVQALKTFLVELGVPEELTVNGSKGQKSPGNEFMNGDFCLISRFLFTHSSITTVDVPSGHESLTSHTVIIAGDVVLEKC